MKQLKRYLVILSLVLCVYLSAQQLPDIQFISIPKSELLMLNGLLIQQKNNLVIAKTQIEDLKKNLTMLTSLSENLKMQLMEAQSLSEILTVQLQNLKTSMTEQSKSLQDTLLQNSVLKKTLQICWIVIPIIAVLCLGIGIALGVVIIYECFQYGILKI